MKRHIIDGYIFCFQKTHLNSKDKYIFEMKVEENNISQWKKTLKKTRIVIFRPNNIKYEESN